MIRLMMCVVVWIPVNSAKYNRFTGSFIANFRHLSEILVAFLINSIFGNYIILI